jgi:dTMP kinase
MARGYFITLEGGEGAGKSTQARRLAAALAAAGVPVLRTREPGGAPGAERIRDLLLSPGSWDSLTEAMLHFAARREHVVRSIRPMLEAGAWVICDRFADSTLAYQGAGQGLAYETWARLCDLTLEGLQPDLTLILDLPVEAGLARAAGGVRRIATKSSAQISMPAFAQAFTISRGVNRRAAWCWMRRGMPRRSMPPSLKPCAKGWAPSCEPAGTARQSRTVRP